MRIRLLADEPGLIPEVARLRWAEWGNWPDSPDLAEWTDITTQEAGHDALPVTFVAADRAGAAAGAVALGEFEPPERQQVSPWIMGMIVRPELRGRGIGRLLLQALLAWAAAQHGYRQFWVATGDEAVGFYQACGWTLTDSFDRPHEHVNILTLTV